MEALERQADKIRAAKAQGAAGAAGGVEANPEEIDLDMEMDAGVSRLHRSCEFSDGAWGWCWWW